MIDRGSSPGLAESSTADPFFFGLLPLLYSRKQRDFAAVVLDRQMRYVPDFDTIDVASKPRVTGDG